MKKWMKKVVVPFMLVSSLGMSGCFNSNKNKKEENKETYTFTGFDDSYYVNEVFVVEGTKLVITDKDGNASSIDVTSDMIVSMPDMTTEGSKTITVRYNGKDYTFTINVEKLVLTPQQEFANKLNEFYSNYQPSDNSEIFMSATNNILVNYFGDETSLEDYDFGLFLAPYIMTDEMSSTMYDALLNSIVAGSFDISEEDVLDSYNGRVKFDTLKALSKFRETMDDADILSYLIKEALKDVDAQYCIDEITSYIVEYTEVSSSIGITVIRNTIEKYFLKMLALEEFEVEDLYNDLLSKIDKYSDSEIVKLVTSKLKGTSDFENIFSEIVYAVDSARYKIMSSTNLEDHMLNGATPEFETGTIAEYILNLYKNTRKEFVQANELLVKRISSLDGSISVEQILTDYIEVLSSYSTEMLEIWTLLEARDWAICYDDGDNWFLVNEDWYFYAEGLDENVGMVILYDAEIDKYSEYKDNFNRAYTSITEEGIYGLLKEYGVIDSIAYQLGIEDPALVYDAIDAYMAGEDMYQYVMDNVLVEEDSYYVDMIVEYLSSYGCVESVIGQQKINEVITKYFTQVRNLEVINVKDLFIDVLTIVNSYTNDDAIRNATSSLKSLDLEQIAHIISETKYINAMNNLKIMTVANYIEDDSSGLVETSSEAKAIIARYAENEKMMVKTYEDAVLSLLSTRNVYDMKDILLSVCTAQSDYYLEKMFIIEELDRKEFVLGEIGNYNDFDSNISFDYIFGDYGVTGIDYSDTADWFLTLADEATNNYESIEFIFDCILDTRAAIDTLVENYRDEIVEGILSFLGEQGMDLESNLGLDVEVVVNNAVDNYIEGTLSVEELIDEITSLVAEYGNEDVQIAMNAFAMLSMVINYDESIDYNEVFKDVPLPDQIESIDYNKLMKKLHSLNAEDIIIISDVNVLHVADDNDVFVGELVTFTIDINFDAVVTSIKGRVTVVAEVIY